MSQFSRFLVPLVLALLTACGGGGGSAAGTAPPVPPTQPSVPPPSLPEVGLTSISLQSEAGDLIGLAKNYAYNMTTADIVVTADKNRLTVWVQGDELWLGVFQTDGADQSKLKAGMVANSVPYEDARDYSKSSHGWFGVGTYCNSSTGWFVIDSVSYEGSTLTQVTLRFERRCNGTATALRGEVRYFANDASRPPLPQLPVPATLWRPPADLAASVGNYAYFESEEGDHVGLGKKYSYDQRNAAMRVSGGLYNLIIEVKGNERWNLELRGMTRYAPSLLPGYYTDVHGSRGHNPVKGGFSWTAEGRGCKKSHGWFAVDSVTTVGSLVTSIDLRFEQHCEGRAAALRGVVRWTDPSAIALPPVVANTAVGSWRAPAASLPTSSNYFYVQSDPGEALAKGLIDLQTGTTAQIIASAKDDTLTFQVNGAHNWRGELMTKLGQGQFTAGNYAAMGPTSSASTGAMVVHGDGHSPNEPKGWLVIDSIRYADGKLVAVDLRFEQLGSNRDGNDAGLLHGQLHWRADQANIFPGPATPPTTFWRPEAGLTPSVGNYVYLESDRSDFIGRRAVYLYTPLDSLLGVTGTGNSARFEVNGDERWVANFAGISGPNQIKPGYYRGQEGGEWFNPVRGRFSWGGDGRGCNESTSGVVVDRATYEGAKLVELHLRFEQHCDNEPGALRGEIRWSASDMRMPQGPAPIPANLWRAPAGTLPAGGNYLYVYSQPGASIGGGKTGLMTAQDTKFFTNTSAPQSVEAYFGFNAQSLLMGGWHGDLQAMVGLKQFQVGFYNWTMRYPFHNKAFGGLGWSVDYVGCNTSIGWFAIDKVTYAGDTLAALHARFGHYCDDLPQGSFGEINWEASPAELMAARMKPQSAGNKGLHPLLEDPKRENRGR